MFDDVLDRARRWAGDWLAGLGERPVGVPVVPAALRAGIDAELPEQGVPATQDVTRSTDRVLALVEARSGEERPRIV